MAKPKEGHHDCFFQIPDELWEALNKEADENLRSATNQVIWILRERYGASEPKGKKRR
jgi:hypothetical protein